MAVGGGGLESLRIAVLAGGPGAERDISLQSGRAVECALREGGLRAELVDVSGDPGEIQSLDCDIVFLALHGEFGEDGTVQSLLEKRGLPYTGSGPAASALALDKDRAKQRFAREGLPTPPWVLVHGAPDAEPVTWSAGLVPPLVVKPNARGSSVGTRIVRDLEELFAAADAALALDEAALIEGFVAGRELTVGFVGEQVLPIVELTTPRDFYDFAAKYEVESTSYACPAELPDETAETVRTLGRRAAEVLGVTGLARTDIILTDEGPMILEVNTIPGFTDHSLLPMAARAAGLEMPDLCRSLLEEALAASTREGAQT